MSITATFFSCSDDPRTVPKTLTGVGTPAGYTLDVWGTCDILCPVLVMAYDATLATSNYMYVAEWGRYYSIQITVGEGERMYIRGTVDAMQTYATQLATCQARACRSEKVGLNDVKDESYPVDPSDELVDVIRLPGSDLAVNAPVVPYYVLIMK